MFEIRQAGEGDIDTLASLVREYWSFENIDGFDVDRCRQVLGFFFARPGLGAGWIAWDGDSAAGYLLACYVFSLEHGGLTAEIDEFFVLPAYRSCGLGRKLLAEAEAQFLRAGCSNAALQIGPENNAARRFYSRCGYKPRGYELLDKDL